MKNLVVIGMVLCMELVVLPGLLVLGLHNVAPGVVEIGWRSLIGMSLVRIAALSSFTLASK